MMDRTPPAPVRSQLRKEVNFGCSVPDCGSPYLTYHHFDPPWHELEHHNPKGMIALCSLHHDMADNGKWSKDELRQLKQNPFLKSNNIEDKNFGWRKRELILAAGGFYINPKIFLRINGRNIVWCTRDESNRLQLNIDLRDDRDKTIISMISDDWLIVSDIKSIEDIEILPHGHSLTVKAPSKGIFLSIRFQEFSQEELWSFGDKLKMHLDQRAGLQEATPISGAVEQEAMANSVRKMEMRKEDEWIREMLLQGIAEGVLRPMPSRCEIITKHIREWPVTVCRMVLTLKYPVHLNISPTQENIGGWRAGHTVSIEPGIAWDMQF